MKDDEIQGLIELNVFERERCDSRKIPLFDDNVAALRQLQAERDALRQESTALREDKRRCIMALHEAQTALTDWLTLHAPEYCDNARVLEAKDRVGSRGTLAYIAGVNRIIINAIKGDCPSQEDK